MKKTKSFSHTNHYARSRFNKTLARFVLAIGTLFLVGSIVLALFFGSGPLTRFVTSPNSINVASTSSGSCTPKTICTRKLDGRKDCTTYGCATTVNGVQTSTITSEIISDTGGAKKVVEHKLEVTKTTPITPKGEPAGNTTTKEVVKKVDPKGNEEIVSTVTTVQAPAPVNAAGRPTAPGEVISEVRTGDITLGVAPYQSGDLDKKKECETNAKGTPTGKVWRNNTCQDPDVRTPEQICTKTISGQATGNTWEDGKCIMKIVPKSNASAPATSNGVDCNRGTCGTSGSPICFGSYASTGQYLKDAQGKSTGEYDCRLCGDNGAGGVGFVGGPQSCKGLLAQNAPVVLGTDANPSGLGLPAGTHTGSCLTKREGTWVLTAVGQPGVGSNEGKVCNINGGWSEPVKVEPPKNEGYTPKTAEDLCHLQHPGYLFGKNAEGKEVCLPDNNANRLLLSTSEPCVPGKSKLAGRDVYITCGKLGVPSYAFCSSSLGFDAEGVCQIDPSVDNPLMGQEGSQLPNTPVEFFKDKPVRATISTGVGCATGTALGLILGPVGMVTGCAVGGYVGNTVGNNISNAQELVNDPQLPNTPVEFFKDKPVRATISTGVGATAGCAAGGVVGSVVPVVGNIAGCIVGGAVGGYVGNTVGNNISNAQELIEGNEQPNITTNP